MLLGTTCVKAELRTLMKLTPELLRNDYNFTCQTVPDWKINVLYGTTRLATPPPQTKTIKKYLKETFFALFHGKDRKTHLRDNLSKGKQTNKQTRKRSLIIFCRFLMRLIFEVRCIKNCSEIFQAFHKFPNKTKVKKFFVVCIFKF